MSRIYNPEDLFNINKDRIVYKESNQISNIKYNEANDELETIYGSVLEVRNEVPLIKFPALSSLDFVKHGFSTRLGGAGEDIFGTMNLSFSRGEDSSIVEENYKRICRALDMNPSDLIYSNQVHKTNIKVVKEAHRGSTLPVKSQWSEIDGLITDVPNLPLVTYYADCVPLYFVDPVHKAIGLVHAGWRGTVQRIGRTAVEAMAQEYGTRAEDLLVVIGPSICRDCYEVSEDVAEEFARIFTKEKCEDLLEQKTNGKYQLDLWLANKYILIEAGVISRNITISNVCTCCNSRLLFSHRASEGKRGNLAAFLSLC